MQHARARSVAPGLEVPAPMLDNPWILPAKTGLSAGLAWGLCAALDIPDPVSAAFVAVVCTSPTVLSGLKRAFDQGAGSVAGAVMAIAVAYTALPHWLALTLAVGGAVALVRVVGFGAGYPVAAFTAIYMYLVPFGGPFQTAWVRIAAIIAGATAAITINTILSAAFYRGLFARRLKLAALHLARRLDALDGGDPEDFLDVFPVFAGITAELADADRELLLRRSKRNVDEIASQLRQVRALTRVAHFARDLTLTVEEHDAPLRRDDTALFRHAARVLRRQASEVPEVSGEIGQRLLAALERWQEAASPSSTKSSGAQSAGT